MSFEDRLGELLKDEDPYVIGPDPVPIIAAAQRRRARRRAGTGAAAVAVALVCGVTAVMVGNARPGGQVAGRTGAAAAPPAGAPAPSPTATGLAPGAPAAAPTATPSLPPRSPVRRITAGDEVEPVTGLRLSVTATESCQGSADPRTGGYQGMSCLDMTNPKLPIERPGILLDLSRVSDRFVAHGFYRGSTPATVMVFEGGRATVATLLVTPGMDDWAAYYVVLPGGDLDVGATWKTPAVGAYDADGRLLAGHAGRTVDGASEQPPVAL
ncbi:hypothetical protein ABZW03_12275 [Kitasatospora sp. NPDC004799]|uniref:hypothetical protein n=1 Tax=Kitasatospora sp. NPDC004799 TaxID=3154460 RepID=UPI0033B46465